MSVSTNVCLKVMNAAYENVRNKQNNDTNNMYIILYM